MFSSFSRLFSCLMLALLVQLIVGSSSAEEPAADQAKISYYKQIRPIFQAHCQGCHQPAKAGGDYVMTSFEAMLGGGESGSEAVVAGDIDGSYLIDQIMPTDGEAEMPKGKPALADSEIELIKRWISAGAVDDTPAAAVQRYDADHPPVYTRPPVITSIDYSPDGRLMAVSGFHEVLLVKADGTALVRRLIGMSERIESVRFSPDGSRLAVTGGLPARMGEIQVWDVSTGDLSMSRPTTYDTVYGGSWSPDGKLIAYGAADNRVRAIDAASGDEVVFMAAHDDWVRDTVFSKSGKAIFSVSRDKTVKMTDVATQRFVGNVTTHTPGVLLGGMISIAKHPVRDELLVGGADGVPKLFRMDVKAAPASGGNPNQIREFAGLPGRTFAVCFSPDGGTVFAGSSLDGSGQLRAFETDSGKELWKTDVTDSGIFTIVAAPDGQQLAAAGADGSVRLISTDTGKIIKQFVPVHLKQVEQPDEKKTSQASTDTASNVTSTKPGNVSLSVTPPRVDIDRPVDKMQLLASVRDPNGSEKDATRDVSWSVSGDVGTVSPTGLFVPGHDGSGKIIAEHSAGRLEIPVTVTGMQEAYQPDFTRDVNPVLTKLGCNAGTCHGSQKGQNGFKLSLRGYDPVNDVRAFTDDLASRRTNFASPGDSLMLLKPIAAVPHEGGKLMSQDDPYYSIIRDWIAAGARLNLETTRPVSIEVFPKNPVIQRPGETQQVRVVATYPDGKTRDVTRESFAESGNTEVATADSKGLMTAVRRGEAPILARYEGAYAATTLTVMGDRDGFVWQDPEVWGPIDEMVAAKWKRMQIQPAPLCSDAEFLRRIYLDLTGLPPTSKQVRDFTEDGRDTQVKRSELVSRLVGSDDYVEYWSNKWADLLQVNGKFLGREGAVGFRKWIRDEIASNTPYDEFAKKIITASGSNRENPAASYYKVLREPTATMENTTHLFMAVRFNCNKCHDHPFERWTQDQYYETAAYFARLDLQRDPASGKNKIAGSAVEDAKPLFEFILDKEEGEVMHDRSKQVTPPKFPYECDYEAPPGATRRQEFAAWLTSPDNDYFARSYVNRLWGYLFGVGIIEPIDDLRAGNPASNPELIDYLTDEFLNSDFDVQHVVRLICTSRTYQLSLETNKWNVDDHINYSHAIARRLPAEVLYDAIHRVTGSVSKIPGLPPGTRAAAIPDSSIKLKDGFLANMGRPARESACECERSSDVQLPRIITFINSDTIGDAISDPNNEITRLVASESDDTALVNEIFMRILNRPATDKELEICLAQLAELPENHQQLIAQLDNVKQEAASRTADRQKHRDALLKTAETDLEAREKEVGPLEIKREQEHREGIAKAETDLNDFDAQLPQKLTAFEQRWGSSGDSWDVLVPGQLSATNGATLEKQDDRSVFVTGKNGKGAYHVVADTTMEDITGVRLEVLADSRLPLNGPGRAGNGNFVLSEIELVAAPNPDLKAWDVVKAWKFDEGSKSSYTWKAQEGAQVGYTDGSLAVSGPAVDVKTELGPWYSVGPFFDEQAFTAVLGPEGKPITLEEKFSAGGVDPTWTRRLDLPDGRVHSFSPGNKTATYFYRTINASGPSKMLLRFGSDDGIKAWLNGEEVLANDVARGAAPDQEQVNVMLKKGDNQLLVKVSNDGGPSSLFFATDPVPAINPAVASEVESAPGSYAVEIVAKSNQESTARVFWADDKNDFNGLRVSQPVKLAGGDDWKTYRFDFVAYQDVKGIRFDPAGASVLIKDVKLYRHELPRKVYFQNAQADYSHESYKVDRAINGKTEEDYDGWASTPDLGETRYASFETKDNIAFKGGARLQFVMDQQFKTGRHSIGRFRLSVTQQPRPVIYGIPPEIIKLVQLPADQRNDDQKKELIEFYKKTDTKRRDLVAALKMARVPREVDAELKRLRYRVMVLKKPIQGDPQLLQTEAAVQLSTKQLENPRLTFAQDLAWVLINNASFMFNR